MPQKNPTMRWGFVFGLNMALPTQRNGLIRSISNHVGVGTILIWSNSAYSSG